MRQLGAGDAAAFRALRLEALRLHPEAFGAAWEEEAALDDAAFAARLMELLRGRDLESLDRLPRPLLSEFVVNEPADL